MTQDQLKTFEERVSDLINVSERLIRILQDENKALAAHDPRGVEVHLEEKDRLCRAYEILVKRMAERKEFAEKLDEGTREELKNVGEDLEELMNENARLLTIAIDSGKRFMNRVSEVAQKETVKVPTYGNNGSYAAYSTASSVAVSHNQNY